MVIVNDLNSPSPSDPKKEEKQEQSWQNPTNPEKPRDERDEEQLLRQKKEAERRKENLSTDDDQDENK